MENDELRIRSEAMVNWLHQKLAEAIGEIATLKADLAVRDHMMANLQKTEEVKSGEE